MRLPWRRQALPAEVRSAVELRPGERVLSACRSGDVAHLVATDRALYVVTDGQAVRWRWDLIDHARWEPPDLTVDVRPDADAAPTRHVLAADPASDVPAVVRDRVTTSIVVNSSVVVPGGTVRVVARRNSDDGGFEWRLVPTSGVALDNPSVAGPVEAELRSLRAQYEA